MASIGIFCMGWPWVSEGSHSKVCFRALLLQLQWSSDSLGTLCICGAEVGLTFCVSHCGSSQWAGTADPQNTLWIARASDEWRPSFGFRICLAPTVPCDLNNSLENNYWVPAMCRHCAKHKIHMSNFKNHETRAWREIRVDPDSPAGRCVEEKNQSLRLESGDCQYQGNLVRSCQALQLQLPLRFFHILCGGDSRKKKA